MKPLASAFALLVLASCANNNATEPLVKNAESTSSKSTGEARAEVLPPPSVEVRNPEVKWGIEGFYTGAFEAVRYDENAEVTNPRITLAIDSMNEGEVFGHTVMAGAIRPFRGTYTKTGELWTVTAKEPGDQKSDGSFAFTIAANKTCKGKWTAANAKSSVQERRFLLKAKTWKYDPTLKLTSDIEGVPLSDSWKNEEAEVVTRDAWKKNPSVELLKSRDVENLYLADLEVLRNSIYARHGYSFRSKRMRSVFDANVPWYLPVSIDVEPLLTDIERKNIELIKRYEKHATKYYESFGR